MKSSADQFAVMATATGAVIFHPTKGQYTVSRSHTKWPDILKLLKERKFSEACQLLDAYKYVAQKLDALKDIFAIDPITGLVTSSSNRLIPSAVADKVKDLVAGGHPTQPLNRFFEKLALAPAQHVWNETLLFMVANDMVMFEDGDILGYKKVRNDYTDSHTGTFNNAPGQRVTMPRAEVDDDRRISCSSGLHVAAFEYAKNFGGGRLVVVKVDPRDVVSIPYDYNNQKMRTCGYQVIAELKEAYEPLNNESGIFRSGDLTF